jgi:hypothetical protein
MVKCAIKKRWIHISSKANALNSSSWLNSIGAGKANMKRLFNSERININLSNSMLIRLL